MRTRSTYSDVSEMKVRFGKLELAFLRWVAREHGVALSEMVRRCIGDMLTKYREAGWYQPEPEREPSPAESALTIHVGREAGKLRVQYPVEFSTVLRSALREALSQHVPELENLIPLSVNEPSTHTAGEHGEETKS